jgi:DNA-binding IclR family transcriptional regulator
MNVFIAESNQWFDSNTIVQKTGVPASTVRHLLLNFFKLGLLERADVFGGYRYRLSPTARAQPYFKRVQEAAAVMKPWNPSELTLTSAAASKQAE